ncbi:hypothetical protein RHSIM_Rhsim02G0224300 [Rhododendron simsii]|uniref:KIB1-4 beta-propeller domain-containing protein n=1 Tax=Rhododendron simsii TaxID=118357 RepID=A0A834HAF8_RHOSS|nr:hypothetical protein RHSIM_Rhsim02G0224300 [Rhododendron simsii]
MFTASLVRTTQSLVQTSTQQSENKLAATMVRTSILTQLALNNLGPDQPNLGPDQRTLHKHIGYTAHSILGVASFWAWFCLDNLLLLSRRSIAINDNFEGSEQIPWLMLSDKDKPDERQFVSLRKGGIICTINLPEARGKRCLETLGWLVTIAEDEESKDYVLVVLHGNVRHLGFWRPGDKSWTNVEVPILGFYDIIFHEGLLFAVKGHGMVLAFDVLGPYPIRPWFGLGIPDICFGSHKQLFIVESAGVVLMVHQDASLPDFGDDDPFGPDNKERSSVEYPTCRFQVFEFASGTKEWVEIMSLGDNGLFLGENASISVDASRFSGMKANCIYYTDNFWNFYQRGGANTGIYSLEDGSKSPCYEEESFNPICPPLWVSPSSF